jgi:drug/metabolite transporter (DMT)-like permease
MVIVALVLLAAALHATWNALVKSVDDRLATMALLGLASVLTAVPLALLGALPHGRAVPFLIASATMHGLYNLLLIACYRDGDFNQVYPVARGLAPPVVAVCAAVFIGERLTAVQAAGLGVVTLGMVAIAAGRGQTSRRALRFAALTGLAIATYTVLDGIGVRRSGSTLGYTAWLFLGQGLVVPVVWWWRRGRRSGRHLPRVVIARGAVAGALSVAAYGLVLWAQTRGALAVVAALRECSVVFAALIGGALFRERMGSRRVMSAALIAGGAVLLAAG